MKKKIVAFLLCSVMALSLAACNSTGDTSAESTPAQIESEPIVVANTQTETTEVTAAPTEEEKPTTTEVSTEDPTVTETTADDQTTTEVSTEDPTVTETTADDSSESPSTPDVEDVTEDQTPTEQQNTGTTVTGLDAYIHNGVFSVEDFGNAIGASGWYNSTGDLLYYFQTGSKGWYVQIGDQNPNHPTESYLVVGNWDVDSSTRWNMATYSYTCSTGDKISSTIAGDFSIEILSHLADTVAALKANPDPNVCPSVSGITFTACRADDAFEAP